MIKIRSLFKHLFCLSIIIINCHCLAQTNLEGEGRKKNHVVEKKNFHEISYQFPLLLGYSYFHNFNDRIVPGFGIKLGLGYLINGYYGSGWIEFLSTDLKFRNLLSKVKSGHLVDYDIGLTYSLMPFQDARFYGFNFQSHIKVIKFLKTGLSVKIGNVQESNENPFFWMLWYPYILFTF